jgi:hypothetical protein
MADGFDVLQQQFPGFRIWQEFAGGRVRYVARRISPGPGLHTVVTADLGELHAALSPGCPPGPVRADCPQAVADDYPGWGVRCQDGSWTAWCPAVTVHAASAAALRALIDQAIAGDDPDWDDPA